MVRLRRAAVVVALICFGPAAHAQEPDRDVKFDPVPDYVPQPQRAQFESRRSTLLKRVEILNNSSQQFLIDCGNLGVNPPASAILACQKKQTGIKHAQDLLLGDADRFNRELGDAAWTSLVDGYQRSRRTVGGVAQYEENRCAIALSGALDVRPRRPDEKTLKDIPGSVHEGFLGTDVLNRYYIRAQQLRDRLVESPPFRKPAEVFDDSSRARSSIMGRRGIVFVQDAGPLFSYDHIDFWDRSRTASGTLVWPARRVWFWEFQTTETIGSR